MNYFDLYLTLMAVSISTLLIYHLFQIINYKIKKYFQTTWNVVDKIKRKKQIKRQLSNDKIRAFHE